MRVFEDLASDIHSAWNEHARDDAVFPELARSALERFAPATAVAPADLLRWIVESDRLPRQFDPQSVFGNLALTLASRGDFHVDALVWTDATTTIHQHTFCGAFHVLQGSSLHSRWSFRETKRWSDRLKRGELALAETEWLKTGSTRPIFSCAQTIHSLFHLENPSVTIVVRTPTTATVTPQLNYEPTGLAYDPFFETERAAKVRQTLSLLWSCDHPEREALTRLALRGVDAHTAARIVSSIRASATEEAQAFVLDALASRDPELAALLCATAAHHERTRRLFELRKQTASSQHRMLLALLLNLPDRASIDRVLRQMVPEALPAEWIWQSIRSMHETPCRRASGTNVLGLHLNEVSEKALRILVGGASVAEASAAIAEHAELLDDARQLCGALAALPIISPLLQ
jgi:hypothetical protein